MSYQLRPSKNNHPCVEVCSSESKVVSRNVALFSQVFTTFLALDESNARSLARITNASVATERTTSCKSPLEAVADCARSPALQGQAAAVRHIWISFVAVPLAGAINLHVLCPAKREFGRTLRADCGYAASVSNQYT